MITVMSRYHYLAGVIEFGSSDIKTIVCIVNFAREIKTCMASVMKVLEAYDIPAKKIRNDTIESKGKTIISVTTARVERDTAGYRVDLLFTCCCDIGKIDLLSLERLEDRVKKTIYIQ